MPILWAYGTLKTSGTWRFTNLHVENIHNTKNRKSANHNQNMNYMWKKQSNSKRKWFYVIIKFRVHIPYIRVLWNWMAHPKRMYIFEYYKIEYKSCNITKSIKCPYVSPLIPTYVMFPCLHLPLHIHSQRYFLELQYMPSCLWKNLYVF